MDQQVIAGVLMNWEINCKKLSKEGHQIVLHQRTDHLIFVTHHYVNLVNVSTSMEMQPVSVHWYVRLSNNQFVVQTTKPTRTFV